MHDLPSRRRFGLALGAAAVLSHTACSMPTRPSPTVVSAFAPTGRLRASINLGNPILARRDGDSAAGVSVDLARALAAQLGVEAELVIVDAALKSVETVKAGRADVGFFAVDPQRSDGIAFSAPYVLIEGAYLVRNDSALRENAEVDRAGTRVMVGKGSAYDLYLTRALKQATLLRAPTSPQVVDAFVAEKADVAAGVKQQLEADAARLGGLRLLPGRFMVIEQAMGVQAGRGADVERTLREFVDDAKRSGFVAEALKRHAIQGATVAP